jgi:thiamine-monophosphate kinase
VGRPPDFVLLGIGDDAAIVEPERNASEVLTTDAIVDGVHFDRSLVPARSVGHKALAVNLSDLAAMGATPRVALLSLGLPPDLPLTDFDAIVDGFVSLAARHRTAIVGGNITRTSGPLFVDVTVTGSVGPRRALRRSSARPGDRLFVSGTLGAAAAGLMAVRAGHATGANAAIDSAVARFASPDPQLRLGTIVGRSRAASACIDLSDGLADGVRQLAAASALGAEVQAETLPMHDAVTLVSPASPLSLVLGDSDDYELLFAVPKRRQRAFRAAARQAGATVTEIGGLTGGSAITLVVDGDARPWPAGYEHFGA